MLNDLEKREKKLNKQVREEKAKVDVLTDQLKHSQDQLKSKDQHITKLNEQLSHLRYEFDQSVAKSDYDRLKGECDHLKEALKSARFNEKSLVGDNAELKDELKAAENSVSQLKKHLKTLEPSAGKLQEVVAERDALVNELKIFSEKLTKSEELRKSEREEIVASYERQIACLEELIPAKSSKFNISSPLLTSSPEILTYRNKSAEGESLGFFAEIRCKELEEQLELVQSQLKERTEQMQSLADQLASSNSKVTNLNEEKSHLTHDLDQIMSKITHLQEQLKSKEIEFSTLQLNFEKSEKEHKSQINSLTLALSRKEAELKSTQSKIIDASKIIDNLRTNVSSSADEISALKMNLDEEKNRVDHLSSLLELNQRELKDSCGVILTMKSTNDSLSSELNEVKKKMQDIEPKYEQNQIELKRISGELEKTKNELKSAYEQLDNLTKQFTELQVNQGSKIRELEFTLRRKDTEYENLLEEKTTIHESLEDITAKYSSATCELESLRSSLEKLEQAMKELNNSKSDYDAQSSQLEKQLAEVNCFLKHKEEEYEKLREEKYKTEESLNKLTQEVSVLRSQSDELEKVKKSLEEEKANSAKQSKMADELWEKLIEESTAANHEKAEHERLKQENSQLQTKIESLAQLKSQAHTLNSEKNVLNNQMEQIKKEKENLAKELEHLRSFVNQLKEQNERLTNSRSDTEKEMQQLTQLLKDRTSTRSDIAQRLEEEIAQIRKSCAENHVKEIQRLNHDLSQFNEMLRKKDQLLKQITEDWRLAEESFKIERATKNRLLNENSQLERRLAELTKDKNHFNATFVMPNANIVLSRPSSPIVNASTPASSCSKDKIFTITDGETANSHNTTFNAFKRPLPIACSSFYVDEEPQHFMNTSDISNISHTSKDSNPCHPPQRVKEGNATPVQEEDPLDRLSILASRNKRQPLHLRTSYPAEFQELLVDEAAIKGIPHKNKCKPVELSSNDVSDEPVGQTFILHENNKVVPLAKPVTKAGNENAPSKHSSAETTFTVPGIIKASSRSVFRHAKLSSPAPKKSKDLKEIHC